jgi:hypothetical protein
MLARHFGLEKATRTGFRRLEDGAERRRRLTRELVNRGVVELSVSEGSRIARSGELFQAFMGALVACLDARGGCFAAPARFPEPRGWVLLPDPERLSFWWPRK